jgi:hypothetical protein
LSVSSATLFPRKRARKTFTARNLGPVSTAEDLLVKEDGNSNQDSELQKEFDQRAKSRPEVPHAGIGRSLERSGIRHSPHYQSAQGGDGGTTLTSKQVTQDLIEYVHGIGLFNVRLF